MVCCGGCEGRFIRHNGKHEDLAMRSLSKAAERQDIALLMMTTEALAKWRVEEHGKVVNGDSDGQSVLRVRREGWENVPRCGW